MFKCNNREKTKSFFFSSCAISSITKQKEKTNWDRTRVRGKSTLDSGMFWEILSGILELLYEHERKNKQHLEIELQKL